MNATITLGFLIGNLFFMFAIEKFMSVFFEQRKTSFKMLALSYALFFILMNAERFTFINYLHLHHYTLSFLVQLLIATILVFIISLNYKALIAKKLIAVTCICVIFTLVIWLVAGITLVMFYHDSLGSPIDWNVEALVYLVSGFIAYLLTFLLRRFKKIKCQCLKSGLELS